MKTSNLLFAGLIAAAGCSNPAPKTQRVASAQTQLNPSQPPYIYVDGEVRSPGQYAWTNGMTLQDAIDSARGFTDFARRGLRVRHSDGSLTVYKLNTKMHLTNNPPVLPGDQIFSPRSFF